MHGLGHIRWRRARSVIGAAAVVAAVTVSAAPASARPASARHGDIVHGHKISVERFGCKVGAQRAQRRAPQYGRKTGAAPRGQHPVSHGHKIG